MYTFAVHFLEKKETNIFTNNPVRLTKATNYEMTMGIITFYTNANN